MDGFAGQTRLHSSPRKKAFNSSLKNTIISDSDYAICQEKWKELKMTSFKDFLVWYNNLDVVPFLEALEKQSLVFASKNIDMFKSAVSLPGLATRWMFSVTESDQGLHGQPPSNPVALIDKKTADLYHSVRKNLVGGPSIVFHRYHEAGKTKLREHQYGDEAKVCGRVLGVDANALYLWCVMQDMPVGHPIVREASNNFAPVTHQRQNSKAAHAWLEHLSGQLSVTIHRFTIYKEKRLGKHGLMVDRSHAKTKHSVSVSRMLLTPLFKD